MFKKLLSIITFVTFLVALKAQTSFQKNIFFETDKSQINAAARQTLSVLVDTLKTIKNYKIQIEGHTDADGSNQYNQRLSAQRTASVKQFLLQNGIVEQAMSTTFFGETRPISDNTNTDSKQQNRRVSLLVLIEATPSVSTLNIRDKSSNITDLFRKIALPTDTFTISASHDTTLICTKGGVFFLPAGACDVPANKQLHITIKEVYNKADMVMEQLTTSLPNGTLLETKGMFFIDITIDGKPVTLKKNFRFTRMSESSDLKFDAFVGKRVPTGNVVWTPPFIMSPNRDPIVSEWVQQINLSVFDLLLKRLKTLDLKDSTCLYTHNKAGEIVGERTLNEMFKCKFQFGDFNNDATPPLYYGIIQKYNNKTRKELIAIRQDLALAEAALKDTLRKIQVLEAYIYEGNSLGWKNIDAFLKLPKEELVAVKVDEPLKPNVSMKLVFKKQGILAYPTFSFDNFKGYFFNNIKRGEEAWLVAIKYENGQPLLSMQAVTTGENMSFSLNFKPVSIENLKNQLALMDKKEGIRY